MGVCVERVAVARAVARYAGVCARLRRLCYAVHFAGEPGDAIIFSTTVLHGAPAVASPERGRRAVALRYLGGDVVVDENRHVGCYIACPPRRHTAASCCRSPPQIASRFAQPLCKQ